MKSPSWFEFSEIFECHDNVFDVTDTYYNRKIASKLSHFFIYIPLFLDTFLIQQSKTLALEIMIRN